MKKYESTGNLFLKRLVLLNRRQQPVKIISLYQNEKRLIKKAVAQDREAQRFIYDKYSAKMLGVCRRYIQDVHFAEDVMVSGFVKVFKHLDSFAFEGSFEGWIRRIMVRESISYLRKKQFVVFDEEQLSNTPIAAEMSSGLDIAHVQNLIDALPQGYKMVFVLNAIEGYKHKEIAEMLNITESTSKSQLFKARKLLQEQLKEQHILGYGSR